MVNDPELIIGLVTPIGTNTSELASRVASALSTYNYIPIIIKLTDLLPPSIRGVTPIGEGEDQRVRRLIKAGDDFCRLHNQEDPEGDPAALARLAIREIRQKRIGLFRQAGDSRPVGELVQGYSRAAYILHSLKRPAEIMLLRHIYASQFVLVGSQSALKHREGNLLSRPMAMAELGERLQAVAELIQLDADEDSAIGQKVNEAYPLADFFLRDNQAERPIDLLFGQPLAPDVGEYAMYVARASRARSLSASRKVGATIVAHDAVIATGYNDVPEGQTPDVIGGSDVSELLKQANILDTMKRLKTAGMLSPAATGMSDADLTQIASQALEQGQLLSVIEYQRAVHAEAKAIDDAAVRGISPAGGTLYVTTYPCHLCYKHALSVKLHRVEYIEPYPKSRATSMYPTGADERLIPYAGVAPQRYMEIFDERPPFAADAHGRFVAIDRSVAQPLLNRVRDDVDREDTERYAVNGLLEEYQ